MYSKQKESGAQYLNSDGKVGLRQAATGFLKRDGITQPKVSHPALVRDNN